MTPMHVVPAPILPAVAECLKRSQALAMLDALLSPEWAYRSYSFNASWAPGEQMASMRNGAGDHYFILFVKDGSIVKTFDHELDRRQNPGSLATQLNSIVPPQYREFLSEPAFSMDEASSIAWFDAVQRTWLLALPGERGAERRTDTLLGVLASSEPAAYAEWAREYFEVDVALEAVQAVFRHEPLTEELVTSINSEISLEDVMEDVGEIGYPVAGT